MAKLYYGNGDCSIEGLGIRGVELRFRGIVKITKTANDNFAIAQQGDGIMIFPIGEGFLNNLFSYVGDLKIISVIAADNNAKGVRCTIKRVMDYSELLTSKAEDLTVKSEDLNAEYSHGAMDRTKISKTTIKDQYSNGELYLFDETPYIGEYHIHLNTGMAMTGSKYTKESQELYIKRVKDNKIIKTGVVKRDRIQRKSTRITRGPKGKGVISKAGGGPGGGGGGTY